EYFNLIGDHEGKGMPLFILSQLGSRLTTGYSERDLIDDHLADVALDKNGETRNRLYFMQFTQYLAHHNPDLLVEMYGSPEGTPEMIDDFYAKHFKPNILP